MITKVTNTVLWAHFISDLIGQEIVGKLNEKELQKTSKKVFSIEKIIKRKDNYMSNGNVMILHLIVGLIRKTLDK